jgi:ketosteroid isomerase-like protein
MKLDLGTLFCTALFISLTSCSRTPEDTHDANVKALRDYQDEWYRILKAKDIEKLAAGFEDDGVVVTPTGAVLNGKDLTMWKHFVSSGGSLRGDVSRIEVSKSGDLGYIWGFYTATTIDPNSRASIVKKGSYLTVYKKQPGGSWKIAVDINNSE